MSTTQPEIWLKKMSPALLETIFTGWIDYNKTVNLIGTLLSFKQKSFLNFLSMKSDENTNKNSYGSAIIEKKKLLVCHNVLKKTTAKSP